MSLLALPASDPDFPVNGVQVIGKLTLSEEYKKRIEAAGHNFEEYYRQNYLNYKLNGLKGSEEEEEKNEDGVTQEDKEKWSKKKRARTAADILQEQFHGNDYYQILGLNDLGMAATETDIKKAYRKMALIYHPDKQETGTTTDPMWLKCQEAYETLMDPDKRRRYESTLEFDETVPEEPIDQSRFYEIFAPVFKRNAIWSNKTPVPDLGDDTTPLNKVKQFYNFWEHFDSKRDFSCHDEYNLEEAGDRYERRWMEKENKRARSKYINKENSRLMKLVENAYNNDPRIIAWKKIEEEAKLKAKLEKQRQKEQRLKEEADRRKKIEDEKQAQIQKEQEEKRQQEEQVSQQKKEKLEALKQLKNLIQEKLNFPEYDRFFIQEFLSTMKKEDAEYYIQKLSGITKGQNAKQIFEQSRNELKVSKEKIKNIQNAEQQQLLKSQQNTDTWTPEQLSLLAKGLQKFPAGTKQRWECIHNYMQQIKTLDEIMNKAKEMKTNVVVRTTDTKIKEETQNKIPITSSQTVIQPKTQQDNKQDNQGTKEEQKNNESNNTIDEWSQEQQKALEIALKMYPASMPKEERWSKIAEAVTGKTIKECVERFKELRAAVLNKKTGN